MTFSSPDPLPVPFSEKIQTSGKPVLKSFGSQSVADSLAYEMNINDMAEAIPMKLDYILFDACFMGGIEVAYEFRKSATGWSSPRRRSWPTAWTILR